MSKLIIIVLVAAVLATGARFGLADIPDANPASSVVAAPPRDISSMRPAKPVPVTPPTPAATMQDFSAAVPPCDPARAYCFGVRVHLATEASAPYVSLAWLVEQFAFANQMFAPVDIAFELHSASTFDAPAVIDGRPARDALTAGVKQSNVIDIFVVGALADLDDAAFPLFGVHWRMNKPSGRRFVILSSYAWSRTMAHELGHFFGLPHSQYAISIMNKAPRLEPALASRRFADEELPIIKAALGNILKKKLLKTRIKSGANSRELTR
jgi:hypothetical protein